MGKAIRSKDKISGQFTEFFLRGGTSDARALRIYAGENIAFDLLGEPSFEQAPNGTRQVLDSAVERNGANRILTTSTSCFEPVKEEEEVGKIGCQVFKRIVRYPPFSRDPAEAKNEV
ncbi:hypothetical protein A8V01_23435 [Novosphingobium guangzhouense]|uniref:Uncharacterized protein n=1 Tax=Novosphingobium guangzhouense TaxID=1850347 RepID=A0A2K2FXP8_9SPHN|nr:hypothetical protein A8V01_23435 [Novosphingobium guangzhouense]